MNTAPVPNAAPNKRCACSERSCSECCPSTTVVDVSATSRRAQFSLHCRSLYAVFSLSPVRQFLLMFAPALLLQLFLLMFLPSIALLFMLHSRYSSTTAAVCSTDTTAGVPGMVLPLLLPLLFPNVAVLQFCSRPESVLALQPLQFYHHCTSFHRYHRWCFRDGSNAATTAV